MSEKVSGTARHNDSDTFRGARGRDHPTRLFPVRLVVGATFFPTARRPGVRGMAIDTPLGSPMEEPAMILNRWYRQPSVPASNDSGTIDRLRRGRGLHHVASPPPP